MSMKAEYAADMEARLAQAGWLRRFARALLGNAVDAEDLAQDTLVAAWRQPSRGGGRAWLSTVARNLAVDRFRGDSRRQRREEAAHTLHDSRVATPDMWAQHERPTSRAEPGDARADAHQDPERGASAKSPVRS